MATTSKPLAFQRKGTAGKTPLSCLLKRISLHQGLDVLRLEIDTDDWHCIICHCASNGCIEPDRIFARVGRLPDRKHTSRIGLLDFPDVLQRIIRARRFLPTDDDDLARRDCTWFTKTKERLRESSEFQSNALLRFCCDARLATSPLALEHNTNSCRLGVITSRVLENGLSCVADG